MNRRYYLLPTRRSQSRCCSSLWEVEILGLSQILEESRISGFSTSTQTSFPTIPLLESLYRECYTPSLSQYLQEIAYILISPLESHSFGTLYNISCSTGLYIFSYINITAEFSKELSFTLVLVFHTYGFVGLHLDAPQASFVWVV